MIDGRLGSSRLEAFTTPIRRWGWIEDFGDVLRTEQDISEFTGNDRFLCDRSPCRGMLAPESEVEVTSPKVICAAYAREMRRRCASD